MCALFLTHCDFKKRRSSVWITRYFVDMAKVKALQLIKNSSRTVGEVFRVGKDQIQKLVKHKAKVIYINRVTSTAIT